MSQVPMTILFTGLGISFLVYRYHTAELHIKKMTKDMLYFFLTIGIVLYVFTSSIFLLMKAFGAT